MDKFKRLLHRPAGQESGKRKAQDLKRPESAAKPFKVGLSLVYSPLPKDSGTETVDIIFVHGLNGDAYETWTSNNIFWPKDLLPTLIPLSRIFTFGYNANLWSDTAQGGIHTFAEGLIAQLVPQRDQSSQTRPIIFVAHSLGGLVVKRAIAFAHNRSDRYNSILSSTKAVVFMGTPHQGSALAGYGDFLTKLWASARGSSSTSSTKQLKLFSETIKIITQEFTVFGSGMEILTFYETKAIPYVGLAVEDWSARSNLLNETCLALNGNHMELCRFSGQDDPNFRIVSDQLRQLINKIVSHPTKSDHPERNTETQEELRKSQYQRDEPQQPPSLPPLPAFRSANFYNRDSDIERIRATIDSSPDDCLRVHCLHGVGGVGKTQIALKYARTVASEGRVVFWLHADQDARLLDDVEDITTCLVSANASAERKPKPQSVFNQWLSKNRNWLVVFDNVNSIKDVKEYWPSSNHGSILVTTRDPGIVSPQLGDKVGDSKVLPFSEAEGTDFIQNQIGSGPAERAAAKELATLLGGLPIALCHAVGYLVHTDSTLQDLLDLPGIRNMSFELLDEHDADAMNFNYELRFATIFEPSLNALAPHTEAVRLLHFLALLNPDSIEETLITQEANNKGTPYCWQPLGNYKSTLVKLRRHSLVDKDNQMGVLRLHRLVRWAVIRSWTAEEWQANFHETFRFLDALFPKQIKGRSLAAGPSFDQCRRVAAHVQALEKGYRQGQSHLTDLMGFANLLANCGYYMYERGLNTAAFNMLESAREICRRERGEEPDLTHALVLNNLAVIHGIRNEPREALALDQQVVAWREALLGPQDIELANSFNNLASKYFDLDDVRNAKLYYEKALQIYEAAEGAHEEILALIAANVGKTQTGLREYREAEGHILRALEIHRRTLGAHYFTSCTLFRLANLRARQGDYARAKAVIDEALDVRRHLLGELDSRVGVAYHKRASILRRLGRAGEGLPDVERAVEAFEASEGNCERGLLPRGLFLCAFILDDMYKAGRGNAFKARAQRKLELALEARERRMGIPKSAPCSSEDDVDTLVQPDFR